MNKNDCINLALILSEPNTLEELQNSIFNLDERIEPHFIEFEEMQGRSDEVDNLTKKMLIEKYGSDWSLSKHSVGMYKECIETARKEVYGDDYHPNMFEW